MLCKSQIRSWSLIHSGVWTLAATVAAYVWLSMAPYHSWRRSSSLTRHSQITAVSGDTTIASRTKDEKKGPLLRYTTESRST